MGNPYEELGVNQNATDEEIKAAYKTLVKKYHPDRHANNPLGDLAEEKLRAVNAAYDAIMDERNGKGTRGSQGAWGGRTAATPEFMEIRRDIDANRLNEAQSKLQRIGTKNAEWIFLDGMISYKKGWYDDALSKIQQAVYMDPQNREYNQALNNLAGAGAAYRNTAYGRGYRSDDDMLCTLCTAWCCADMCCDCM